MRLTRFLLVLGLASATWIAISAQAQTPPGQKPAVGTGIIAGRVLEADSTRGVEEALVTLSGEGIDRRVMVDERGRFVFANLPAGSFSIDSEQFGYLRGSYGRTRPNGPATRVQLTDGQRLLDATISMWRSASITGRVVDDAGEPIARITVNALVRRVQGGRVTLDPSGQVSAGTDDRGVYRISGLVPGNYAVAVRARLSTFPVDVMRDALTSGVNLGVGEVARLGDSRYLQLGDHVIATMSTAPVPPAPLPDGRLVVFQTTYYPNAASAPDALVIPIKAGEERTGVDIQLQAVPTVSVSGQITGPDGPVGLTPFRLVRAGGEAAYESYDFETATGLTTPDGRFTLLGVPRGRYEIRLGPRTISGTGSDPDDKLVLIGRENVVVGNADVTNVFVTARTIAMLRGRIETRPGANVSAGAVALIIQAFDSGPLRVLNPRVDKALAFSTQIVPGRYVMSAWADAERCPSVLVNGKEVGDALVSVGYENINVVFGCGGATARVSGRVRDANGNPDLLTQVVLFSTERRHWAGDDHRPLRVTSEKVDPSGNFSLAGVPAGEYFIAAIPDAIADGWRDPAVLETLVRSATRITVATEARTIDLVTVNVR